MMMQSQNIVLPRSQVLKLYVNVLKSMEFRFPVDERADKLHGNEGWMLLAAFCEQQ